MTKYIIFLSLLALSCGQQVKPVVKKGTGNVAYGLDTMYGNPKGAVIYQDSAYWYNDGTKWIKLHANAADSNVSAGITTGTYSQLFGPYDDTADGKYITAPGELPSIGHPKPHKRKKGDTCQFNADSSTIGPLPCIIDTSKSGKTDKGDTLIIGMVGVGLGAISGISYGSYNFSIGYLSLDLLTRGSFNIVVKDSGLMNVQDTSFAFCVDFKSHWLDDYPCVAGILREIDRTFKKYPKLRTDTAYQVRIHKRLNLIMQCKCL